ncbi:accessory factor UbiK family protein [Asticcacaulis endophyticus]|uniref:BMFP domain-containing protein YqiC n=1 Tax=Asticcacaulis endophyticus TaxID=1395890 RepID=A0A918Q8P1_9CAUL|nr:accessory factor UbiK family protein [Asticcacaulis endophyticus]GGZ36527.1 hypothetical protein GCM10011273_23580 [Asticcacaulis endophyticus]
MQTKNPFMDEFAKMTTNAMSLAQAAGEEAKSAFRAQADKWVADMDLVRRDEYEALAAQVAELRAELATLKAAKKPAAKKDDSGPAA